MSEVDPNSHEYLDGYYRLSRGQILGQDPV